MQNNAFQKGIVFIPSTWAYTMCNKQYYTRRFAFRYIVLTLFEKVVFRRVVNAEFSKDEYVALHLCKKVSQVINPQKCVCFSLETWKLSAFNDHKNTNAFNMLFIIFSTTLGKSLLQTFLQHKFFLKLFRILREYLSLDERFAISTRLKFTYINISRNFSGKIFRTLCEPFGYAQLVNSSTLHLYYTHSTFAVPISISFGSFTFYSALITFNKNLIDTLRKLYVNVLHMHIAGCIIWWI